MPINQRFLDKIWEIKKTAQIPFDQPLPVEVHVPNKAHRKAEIHNDGRVYVLPGQKPDGWFESPSAMRSELIGNNRPTYKYIYFNGQSLAELGIHR